MKDKHFQDPILKLLQNSSENDLVDTVNLQDEKPTILMGAMQIQDKEESVPPFYVSLNIHEKVLHDCLLDLGASHNLMPKVVMEELGLQITKPYHDLFTFDSRNVQCLGVIKDLAVNLTQIPSKGILMDIVVADISPKFGMLLSRLWTKRLGGSLQNDFSYASIPVFGGQLMRLYREQQFAYIVSDPQNPSNHLVYAVSQSMDSCILQLNDDYTAPALKQSKLAE